jgi:hypothetical protein
VHEQSGATRAVAAGDVVHLRAIPGEQAAEQLG